MKLEEVVKALKDLPPGKIAIGLGALCVAAAVLQFRDDMVILIVLFGSGLFLVILGLILGIVRAKAKERAKDKDLEFRKYKMEKGLSVEDDKTIIKFD